MTLEFGSRSGSWFALCLFAAMFGVLGWGVAREIRLRSRARHQVLGAVLGVLLFAGPVGLIYASSLSGFYEADVGGGRLRLHYLLPKATSEIPLRDITAVRAVPWYQLRSRIVVTTTSGATYESATWRRQEVAEGVIRLEEMLRDR